MKKEYTSAELAKLLECSTDTILRLSKKEAWLCIPRSKKEGGALWKVSSMAKTTQEVIANKELASVPVLLETKALTPVEPLLVQFAKEKVTGIQYTQKQLQVRDARLYILNIVRNMAQEIGISQAEQQFVSLIYSNAVEHAVLEQLAIANMHSAGIASSTLKRWRLKYSKCGADALIPQQKIRYNSIFPNWLNPFLNLYRMPSKPTITQCYEKLHKEGLELPTLRTVQRTIKKLGTVELQKGRMLPREHKKLLPFVRRSLESLLPADVYTADGHTMDMYVQHPMHGKPFRPEVTSILDVATRVCVGFSISLNENSYGVADALRMAVSQYGIPAIFYTDNGSGFKNRMLEQQNIGMLARLGISAEHSLPYASQARGLIERFQQVLIRGARETVGYAGRDMDKEAFQLVHKLAKKEIARTGKTKYYMPWNSFMQWLAYTIAEYNNRTHSALKTSPNKRWEELASNADIITPTEEILQDLFRPYEERKIARCEVKLFNNIYFSRKLEDFHGETLRIGYDIHNPETVWVRDCEGRFITTAELNGNKVDYFPKSVVEKAQEKRLEGRLARLETHSKEALEEYYGSPAIEYTEPTQEQQEKHALLVEQFEEQEEQEQQVEEKELEDTREARFMWALELQEKIAQGVKVNEEEKNKLEGYTTTPEYSSMKRMQHAFGDTFLHAL